MNMENKKPIESQSNIAKNEFNDKKAEQFADFFNGEVLNIDIDK